MNNQNTNESQTLKLETLKTLKQYIGRSQQAATNSGLRGEERQYFVGVLNRLADTIKAMPTSYQTDGMGNNAIIYLHYFHGSADWYITERDIDSDGEGQVQAFGYADLGYGPEAGYISIRELIECGVELDYHWTPREAWKVLNQTPDQINEERTA